MRRLTLCMLVASMAIGGLAGCQSSATVVGGGTGSVPVLDAEAARSAGLSPEGASEGRSLCAAKCVRCHKFYRPADYNDAKWELWMRKMSKKAKLTAEQEEILSRYLSAYRVVSSGKGSQ